MPEITMPKLSDTMTEGTLLRWCKEQGDTIEIGELLAEVETDKATMEMESFEEGVLSEIFVPAGSKAPVGAPIAFILGKNEDASAITSKAAPGAVSSATVKTSVTSTPASSSASQTTTASRSSRQAIPGATATPAVRIKSSPLARKIAAERGLSLAFIAEKGTGPGGRIIAADVINASLKNPAAAATASTGAASSATAIWPTQISGNPETQIPLTNMRQVIAQRLLASKTQIPHFYLSIEIDAAPMVAFRKEFNASGKKITFNDIVLLAAARAAIEKPKINASFGPEAIYQYESVNLCVAIAIEDGLVTPVIRNAQQLSLSEISTAVKDLATRAREKKLKPDEFVGGTLTVSNLGAYGIDQFCGIINPPQAAILAVGAIVKKPVVNAENNITVGQRLNITLSGDHRVVDGAVAAEYLSALRALLEAPAKLLL